MPRHPRRRLAPEAAAKITRSSFGRACGIVLGSLLLTACSLKPSFRPSVLVILVEDLGFGSFSCSDGQSVQYDRNSGLQVFCDEAVRFTHAYAPSTLSQASVASMLTGKSPRDHGVRNNGPQALPASMATVAEKAVKNGFRTSFFSGGPPIFRRAFNQGFEVFDDHILVSFKRLYRPAAEIIQSFLSWQTTEAARGPFLSFLYLADLQFPQVPTANDLGELRETSYASQLDEVDETLGHLVHTLKRRKIWDHMDVFLIGLGGDVSGERDQELRATNLFSESVHATVMIKPSRKTRNGPYGSSNWKIDTNISLLDVGATLFDLISDVPLPTGATAVTLRSALREARPKWSSDRMIVTESAWLAWRDLGGIRASVRRGSYLYLFDVRDRLFNTLTDNFEASPVPNADEASREIRRHLADHLRSQDYQPWQAPSRNTVQRLELGKVLWKNTEPTSDDIESLRILSRRYPNDTRLIAWRAILALKQNNWKDLQSAAAAAEKALKNSSVEEGQLEALPLDYEVWSYVADRNLGEKTVIPDDPCIRLLLPKASSSRDCTVEGARDLSLWTNISADEPDRTRSMEALMRLQIDKALKFVLARQNYSLGGVWDVSMAPLDSPDPLELLLALPEFRKPRAAVRSRLLLESR